jgi:hypothetical protein
MGWLRWFVSTVVLPFAIAGLVVALLLCALVLIVKPAHGAEAVTGNYEYVPPERALRWSDAGWKPRHTSFAIVDLLSRYYDSKQTLACLSLYPKCHEGGPMISGVYGDNPSANQLYKWSAAMWAINQFVAYQLDPPWRDAWQWIRIVDSLATLHHNHGVLDRVGAPKPDFPAGLMVLVVVPFLF